MSRKFLLITASLFILSIFLLGLGFGSFLSAQKNSPLQNNTQEPSVTATASGIVSGSNQELAHVKRTIDGDTIELSDGRKLRYIGVDTPETVDPRRPVGCFGKEASSINKELVTDKDVFLEKDISETDKFGRLLRYVYVEVNGEKVFVNKYLVEKGYALVSSYPPDVKYQDELRKAESFAREQNNGLWAFCPTKGTSSESPLSAIFTQSSSVIPSPLSLVSTSPSAINSPAVAGAITGCTIKGNISSSGDKIYHMNGCGSYEKTVIDESVGEKYFCSEDEAQKAGWRKAKNC